MKIFVSSDIEGVAGLSTFSETKADNVEYPRFQNIMTNEVVTICHTLHTDKVFIRDGHMNGRNIKIEELPKNATIIRNYGSQYEGMFFGIDKTFDGVILHGFHSAGGTTTSPVAHTFNSETIEYIKINGKIVGETTFAFYTCALYNLPIFYLEGDEGAVLEAEALNKNIIGTITKEFDGKVVIAKSPQRVHAEIIKDLKNAMEKLKKDPEDFIIKLPKTFEVEIRFKIENHRLLKKENVTVLDEFTILYKTDDFIDVLKLLR